MLFHPWMRGEVKDPSQHTHLGLYVAKLIVVVHGGEITVASDEERGTTFRLEGPRA